MLWIKPKTYIVQWKYWRLSNDTQNQQLICQFNLINKLNNFNLFKVISIPIVWKNNYQNISRISSFKWWEHALYWVMKMIYFYFIIYPICCCSKFNMNICIIFLNCFCFIFVFKRNHGIWETFHSFNHVSI